MARRSVRNLGGSSRTADLQVRSAKAGLEAPASKKLFRRLPIGCWPAVAGLYPIGAFSYSHGVETAVEEGLIRNIGTPLVACCAASWRTAPPGRRRCSRPFGVPPSGA